MRYVATASRIASLTEAPMSSAMSSSPATYSSGIVTVSRRTSLTLSPPTPAPLLHQADVIEYQVAPLPRTGYQMVHGKHGTSEHRPYPSFELLKPHLEAGHDLIPIKPLSKEPTHFDWPITP